MSHSLKSSLFIRDIRIKFTFKYLFLRNYSRISDNYLLDALWSFFRHMWTCEIMLIREILQVFFDSQILRENL